MRTVTVINYEATRVAAAEYQTECARLRAEYSRTRDSRILRHIKMLGLGNVYRFREVSVPETEAPEPLPVALVARRSWWRRLLERRR